jgi:ABC-type sugar transport system permease subunit
VQVLKKGVVICMKKLKIETKQKMIGFAFVSPWIIGFILFSAYPLLYSLYMSFNKVKISGDKLKMQWVGFANYNKALFQDAEITNSLIKVLQNTIIIIPIIVVFAIIMALLLNEEFKGRSLIRAIFFLPVLLTSGNLIESLTAQGQGSISFLKSDTINNLIAGIGGSWGDTLKAVLDSFLIILWYSGIQMLILIAGMQSINPSVYEAATIDGAGKWESLWLITLPNLMPFILLSTIYTIVDQFTAPFSKIMNVIKWHTQNVKTGYGYASAIAFLYFLVIMAVIGVAALLFRKSITNKRGR